MDTGNLFNEYYYKHNCGIEYKRSQKWLDSFERIAARIADDIRPTSVLDAGCAMGFLVERLRARGIQAWGIDISEYAIANVAPEVKEFCRVGSILDPLPQKYDLIVSIEVLEHMPAEMSVQALERLCGSTDDLLISVSHGDFKEATHLNVQPPEYWARHFGRLNFYHDVEFDASFITPWAARYRKQNVAIPAISAYERKVNLLTIENRELRAAVVEQHLKISELSQKLGTLETAEELVALRKQAAALDARWKDLEAGSTWKFLTKIQTLRTGLIPPNSARERLLRKIQGRGA